MKKYVSWRHATIRQKGKSDLELEVQKKIIDYFVKDGKIIADFKDVSTSKDLVGCTELRKALDLCKKEGATLVISETKIVNNEREALKIFEEINGNILFCNLHSNDKKTLVASFALAERKAKIISIQTKAALEQKKEKGGTTNLWGKKLGLSDEEIKEYRKKCGKKAGAKAAFSKKTTAKNNPINKKVWSMLNEHYKALFGRITANTDFKKVAEFLNNKNLTTSTGLPFNSKRARATYFRLQDLYRN